MAIISGRSLASYGALGGIMITYKDKDPEDVGFGLMSLAGHVENIQKPMLAMKAIAKADMAERFKTDTAPGGEPWFELSEEYKEYKAEKGYDPDDILTRRGRLERATQSEAAWGIVGPNLVFYPDALPKNRHGVNYGMIHQDGSDASGRAGVRQAQKRHSLARGKEREATGAALHKAAIGMRGSDGGSRGASGEALPARPFIGLSFEAEIQMASVLDMWFDEGVRVHITGAGTVQQIDKGRFGSKLFPSF